MTIQLLKKEIILALVIGGIAAALSWAGWLPIVNALGLGCVVTLAWLCRQPVLKPWIKLLLFFLLVPLVYVVATYRPLGFSYPLLFSLPDANGLASRFDLYVNFSKAMLGLCLLSLLWPKRAAGEFVVASQWRYALVVLAPALIIGVAIGVFDLGFQLKTLAQITQFALVNLFVMSIAEEAFMRLLLQQRLRNALACTTDNLWVQELISLLLVTGIFVAIHTGIGGAALWVYGLAGFLYAMSYTLSKNILYPVAIHFLVNQIHFSFLSYPLE
jgi:uncharacterized protein